jgi:hypothetical protein
MDMFNMERFIGITDTSKMYWKAAVMKALYLKVAVIKAWYVKYLLQLSKIVGTKLKLLLLLLFT